ncbi:MAG: hypothetical protein ACYS8W_17880 [Planctomycetota bacterium]
MDRIVFKCECGAEYERDASYAGREIRCFKCDRTVTKHEPLGDRPPLAEKYRKEIPSDPIKPPRESGYSRKECKIAIVKETRKFRRNRIIFQFVMLVFGAMWLISPLALPKNDTGWMEVREAEFEKEIQKRLDKGIITHGQARRMRIRLRDQMIDIEVLLESMKTVLMVIGGLYLFFFVLAFFKPMLTAAIAAIAGIIIMALPALINPRSTARAADMPPIMQVIIIVIAIIMYRANRAVKRAKARLAELDKIEAGSGGENSGGGEKA